MWYFFIYQVTVKEYKIPLHVLTTLLNNDNEIFIFIFFLVMTF